MDRIHHPTAIATPPAVDAHATPGYPTEGNPLGSVPATIMTAYLGHSLIEEIRNVIVAAGLTPDKAALTQLRDAIAILAQGRLLNVRRITSSGTYTPTAGTRMVLVRAIGGGGAGGGTPSAASAAGAAAGGTAGAYGEGLYTTGFSGVTMTIGAGGAGAAGAAGGNGGTTSFGALLSCPGGPGAGLASGLATFSMAAPAAQSGLPSGANIIGVPGEAGGHGTSNGTSSSFNISGRGARTPFGPGGTIIGGSTAGNAAPAGSYGAGGGGASVISSGTALAGGAGHAGVIIVEEYA